MCSGLKTGCFIQSKWTRWKWMLIISCNSLFLTCFLGTKLDKRLEAASISNNWPFSTQIHKHDYRNNSIIPFNHWILDDTLAMRLNSPDWLSFHQKSFWSAYQQKFTKSGKEERNWSNEVVFMCFRFLGWITWIACLIPKSNSTN